MTADADDLHAIVAEIVDREEERLLLHLIENGMGQVSNLIDQAGSIEALRREQGRHLSVQVQDTLRQLHGKLTELQAVLGGG